MFSQASFLSRSIAETVRMNIKSVSNYKKLILGFEGEGFRANEPA